MPQHRVVRLSIHMSPELDPMAPRARRCHQRSGRVQYDAVQVFQPSASSHSDKEVMEIKSAYECHSTVLSCFIGG